MKKEYVKKDKLDRARLTELKKKDVLSDEEESELDYLQDWYNQERHAEILDAIPRPTCCDAIKKYPCITFSVDIYDGDPKDLKGHWYASMNEKISWDYGARDLDWYKNMPEPKFCPYCATPLPKMALKNPIPDTVCRVTDGGYYCDTCKERLHCCMCDPPACAFEPT